MYNIEYFVDWKLNRGDIIPNIIVVHIMIYDYNSIERLFFEFFTRFKKMMNDCTRILRYKMEFATVMSVKCILYIVP